ncbi:sulfurtransferase [Amphritea sp. HPY]|uniref:sulfurtransferase n=1 Tax=Amphritea sp. HPY TaxID=3421652 RepID=UPI003D7CEFB4
MYTTLISAEQLSSLIDSAAENLLVLDCRFNLMDTALGARLYGNGHIPGARYIDLDNDLSSPITPLTGRHPLPDFTALANTLARSGVNPGSQVVVYDDCGGAMAGRAWWLLRVMGHEAVAVLDGGFPAWSGAGLSATTLVPEPQAGNFSAKRDQEMIVTLEQLTEVASENTLVDARTPERFRGEQEPIDPVAGHIPGAINRPLQLNLNVDGCFKSAAQLKQEWSELLSNTSADQVIHYCGSGVTACHNYLAMEIAGLSGSRIYAGSWSEWIRNSQRPVATGN